MRILVIGAGPVGARVLRQLQKNPKLTVITVDAQENPYAVEKGVISQVDIPEALTPLNLEQIIAQAQPDLILLTRVTEDLGLGDAPGMGLMADALRDELVSISEVPMIEVARTASR